MEVFQQENWLQIADHIATIVFGALTLILTIIVIHLELRDRTKRLAIKELQTQTKELRNLYMLSIQPRFTVSRYSDEYTIKNIGGDAYNIEISPNFSKKNNRIPKDLSSKTSKKIFLPSEEQINYEFCFSDCLGNRYRQIFHARPTTFSLFGIYEQ